MNPLMENTTKFIKKNSKTTNALTLFHKTKDTILKLLCRDLTANQNDNITKKFSIQY